MSDYGMLLYPSVIKALRLNDSYLSMKYYPWSGAKGMDFEEVIFQYINFKRRMTMKKRM